MKKQNSILPKQEENNMQVAREFSGIKVKNGARHFLRKKFKN